MAKELKKFTFREARSNTKYHWDQFFNGSPWVLKQAEDFPGVADINHMPPKIKTAARARYKVCRVELDREALTVTIQAREMTADEREAEDIKRVEEKLAREEAKATKKAEKAAEPAQSTTAAV